MIFIGILFDTKKLTIAIDENRLTEIRLAVECWMHKMMASKRNYEVPLSTPDQNKYDLSPYNPLNVCRLDRLPTDDKLVVNLF
jgi:hypothetical protein